MSSSSRARIWRRDEHHVRSDLGEELAAQPAAEHHAGKNDAHHEQVDDDRLLRETLVISAGDIVWVVATIVVLAAQILTTAGVVTAVAIGVMVGDFGLTQLWLRAKALGRGADRPSPERTVAI